MAQTPSTTKLGLNQWNSNDPLNTAQFNEDNRIIDTQVTGLQNRADNIENEVTDLHDVVRSANLIINGSLTVWQRGESFNVINTTGGVYTADRLKCRRVGDVQVTVSRLSPDSGGMRITGSGQVEIRYIMELTDFSQIDGKNVALSYSRNGEVEEQTFVANLQNCPIDGAGRRAFTITLTECTIGWIKLELGNVATPFVPRTTAEEFSLCQRYYEESGSIRSVGQQQGGFWTNVVYNVTKRATPNITLSSPVRVWVGSTIREATAIQHMTPNTKGFGFTAIQPGPEVTIGFALFSFTADAEL